MAKAKPKPKLELLPKAAMRRVEKVLDAQEGPSSFVDRLPFVGSAGAKRRKDQLPRDFWHNVKSTGDFDEDGKIGSAAVCLGLHQIPAAHVRLVVPK